MDWPRLMLTASREFKQIYFSLIQYYLQVCAD